MKGISNYNKGESLATGFARPKVTSLFFDKIWLPNSILDSTYEYTGIPKELLVEEDKELCISQYINSGELYNFSVIRNSGKAPEEISAGHMYRILCDRNDIFNFDAEGPLKFKYSKNRNNAILLNTENFCRKYKIKISPVFHSLTDFERESAQINSEKLYGNNNVKFRVKKPNTYKNKNVLSICIEDFPDIVEYNLSWEQVLDIRKDKKEMGSYASFYLGQNVTFKIYRPTKYGKFWNLKWKSIKKHYDFLV